MTAAHCAVLLAAGGSRRLGQSKALLTAGGVPLVRVMAQRLLATAPRRLLVVTGADAHAIAAHLAGLAAERVDNLHWATGQSSSLRLAADALASDPGPVLLAGVDQPALDLTHLLALLARFDGDHDIVSGYAGTCGIPVLLRAQTFRQASTLQGDQGLGARLRARDARVHVVRDDALALDIDTESDLQRARAAGLIDHAP